VVKVNSRKVLDGLMESVGLGGNENAGRRLTVLRAIDKLDKFRVDEVAKLLGPGRWDGGEEGKGDFTKGAGLSDSEMSRVINFTGWGLGDSGSKSEHSSNAVTLANFETVVEGNALGLEGVDELAQIKDLVAAGGYDDGRVVIDPSVVRGLEYYTGPVYEVELLLDTKDEKGRPVRFGSVGGGGRYDGLVSRFRGEPVPATGFSIGVSRLQAALTLLGKLDSGREHGPVVVTVFGGDIADYQKMVATLRNAGIRAELYLGNPKHSLGQQMKYADRRNAPCAIVQGSDEKARAKVQIKDLILGAGLTEIKDREEYLKRQAEAQTEVDSAQLVEAVRQILARHAVRWG
jgi:histidyl-tRNA synthetase